MKFNIYTYIFFLLALHSMFIISNTLGQDLLGTVLAIVF